MGALYAGVDHGDRDTAAGGRRPRVGRHHGCRVRRSQGARIDPAGLRGDAPVGAHGVNAVVTRQLSGCSLAQARADAVNQRERGGGPATYGPNDACLLDLRNLCTELDDVRRARSDWLMRRSGRRGEENGEEREECRSADDGADADTHRGSCDADGRGGQGDLRSSEPPGPSRFGLPPGAPCSRLEPAVPLALSFVSGGRYFVSTSLTKA